MGKSQDVINFRQRTKKALVESFGNKCQICNNTYPQSVYDFHHLNPEEKEFGIGSQNTTRSKAATAKEAKKCIMVCANCHRLIEHENLSLEGIKCNFNEEVYYSTFKELTKKNKKIIIENKATISVSTTNKPSREVLKEQIRNTPFLQLSKMYGVSDNAIRKWCKSYNLPSKVTDIKNIKDEDWINI